MNLLLAGDIGATTTRLALVSADAGARRFVLEREYSSGDHAGLESVAEAPIAVLAPGTGLGEGFLVWTGAAVRVVTVNAALLGAATFGLSLAKRR